MPQTDLIYNTAYNRGLIAKLHELDEKQWEKAYPSRTPTPMGQRIGMYHGDLTGAMVGGGSSPMKYNPSGNSSAYPPMNLSAGLAVSSGGSHYAGIDGAISAHPAEGGNISGGKYTAKKFFRDVGRVGKKIVKNPIVKEVGKELLKEGVKQGIKALASGAGGRAKRADIVKKVMGQRGCSMIEASKIVKAEGLY